MHITLLFPGQGSQKIGMGKDFFDNFSLAKELIEAASDRLHIDFEKLLFDENEQINQTAFTQPAIFLVSLIAYKVFSKELEIEPHFSLGHSLGEFSALSAVGALDIIDGVELVHKRGKFMSEASLGVDGGMMAVLGLADEVVEKLCEDSRKVGHKVWPANYNSDGQVVIAGLKSDLQALEDSLKEAGAKRVVLLNMSVASHCPLMESAREPLREYLEKFIKDSFSCSVISNVTAKPYKSKKEAIELLDRQLVEPVLYKHSIKNVEEKTDIFLEFGEGGVLKGLNRRITKKPTFNIKDHKTLKEFLEVVTTS